MVVRIDIAMKAIADMPPTVQHFLKRLLEYDYNLLFAPGKQMKLAGMLT